METADKVWHMVEEVVRDSIAIIYDEFTKTWGIDYLENNRISVITSSHDFKEVIRQAYEKMFEQRDRELCHSNQPDKMCLECDCWKMTRKNCS